MSRLRLGVLISGRGSNLRAILEAIELGDLDAEVALVVSNNDQAAGLRYATERAISTLVVERSTAGKRDMRQDVIRRALDAAKVGLVVLAGWNEVLVPSFVDAFAGRMINVHPSLLPAFGGGMRAQAGALAYGARVTGCTVHFVTTDVDSGPIIVQRAVPVLDDDTVDTLSARILAEEHKGLPEAIGLIAESRLVVDGRRVRVIEGASSPG